MATTINDSIVPGRSGDWRFGGFLGERIDTFTDARIRSDFAREVIHQETVEAFRKRIDDRMKGKAGFWQGEFWGKWILSAIAACRYYGDDQLREFIAESARSIIQTQDPDGYIGTYSDPGFLQPIDGNMNWNVWCRKYTLWGLLGCHELLGDDEILDAAVRLTDHLLEQVGPGKTDIILTGKMHGMPSTSILTPIVWLYRLTGDERYLEFGEYIVEQWSRHPDGPPDLLRKGLSGEPIHSWFPRPQRWAKSYELISCAEGLLHLYRVTGKKDYLRAVRNIHENIRRWERSPIGSVSFNDKFVGSRRLINTVAEVCDAVYWNRLSFELLQITGDPSYAEEIERTLYNALLCGIKLDGAWALRRLRLSHEHVPANRHCNLEHHHCCVDNLPRGLLQPSRMAMMRDQQGIYCALYNPGRGRVRTPAGRPAEIRITGGYPENERVAIDVSLQEPEEFILNLRIPSWSDETAVTVNGEDAGEPAPGEWFSLQRDWQTGDRLELTLDMSLRAERFDPSHLPPDDDLVTWSEQLWARIHDHNPDAAPHTLTPEDALPHREAIALLRGPVVLSRDMRVEEGDVFGGLPAEFDLDRADAPMRPDPPKNVWQAFDLDADGETIGLCDFASAGNTWDEKSEFNTWQVRSDGSA